MPVVIQHNGHSCFYGGGIRNVLFAIGLFLLIAGTLIAVHEFGHFLLAKLCGVRVHEFMIGFGPAIIQFSHGNTLYTLRAIPLGGAVRMEGIGDQGERERSGDIPSDSFYAKPYWQRILIIAGGPLFNILFAIVLFFVVLTAIQTPVTIVDVLPESPALQAGLQAGDKILAVNDVPIGTTEELVNSLRSIPSEEVTIVIKRGNEVLEVVASTDEYGKIGVQVEGYMPVDPAIAARISVENAVDIMADIGKAMINSFRGEETIGFSGPIGIANALKDAAINGPEYLITVVAIISLNLAFFNLLPIPVLDGGQIFILLVQAMRNRQLTRRQLAVIQTVGVVVILGMTVIITITDILRLIVGR